MPQIKYQMPQLGLHLLQIETQTIKGDSNLIITVVELQSGEPFGELPGKLLGILNPILAQV